MDKFIINPNVAGAFYGNAAGAGDTILHNYDIIIYNQSNTTVRSTCNIGSHYQSPQGITYSSAESQNFLDENYNRFGK